MRFHQRNVTLHLSSSSVCPQLDLILFGMSPLCHHDRSLESGVEEEDYTSVNYPVVTGTLQDLRQEPDWLNVRCAAFDLSLTEQLGVVWVHFSGSNHNIL